MSSVRVGFIASAVLGAAVSVVTPVHAADPAIYQQPLPPAYQPPPPAPVYQQPVYQQPVYQPPYTPPPAPPVVYQAPPPPPPPVYAAPPAPSVSVQEFQGWYLRGDIGVTQQQVKSIDNALFAGASGFTFLDEPSFGTGMMFGIGVGYQMNDWMRFDVTAEYRGKTEFHALDSFNNGGVVNTNDYTANKREWLVLANAYVDFGTFWCVTPFVGVGVGVVDTTISNYRDRNDIANGGGWASSASKQNIAWALHAGLSYKVTNNFVVELGYRYLYLGDATTGDTINFDGTNFVNNPTTFKDITSHDLKLGLRWMCCEPERPVYVAPQPAYMPPPPPPPPVYQPPLRSKG
ncbi:MAG: outer membrane protein [Pseudorhodoplanes sp.]